MGDCVPLLLTSFEPTPVLAEQAEITLAAFVRQRLPGQSWSQVRRLIESRRVRLNGESYLDPARRVHAGETVELLARALPPLRERESLVLRHLDEHVVVVEQ